MTPRWRWNLVNLRKLYKASPENRKILSEWGYGLGGMHALAFHPNTSPETLAILSRFYEGYVRWGVAQHDRTPPKVLEDLANDEFFDVRWGVAGNRNTPPDILRALAKPKFGLLEALAANPSTPSDVLADIPLGATCKHLAHNPNTPIDTLCKIAGAASNDPDVLTVLAANPNTPEWIRISIRVDQL